MAFWSDNQVEPKRKFKFLLTIDGATQDETIPSFVVKKVTKPSFKISESSHQFLGNKFYFPGKLEWNEIDITLIDAGGFNEKLAEGDNAVGTVADGVNLQSGGNQIDITSRLVSLITKFGYQNPELVGQAIVSGFNDGTLKTFSKFAGVATVPSIRVQQLDSNGNAVETWELKNAWVKEITFGELDYTSEDLTEITLKLRYDWAVLNPA